MNKFISKFTKVILCAGMAASISACSSSNTSDAPNNTETLSIDENLKTSFKDDTIKTPECTMKIKEAKVVPPITPSFMDVNELVVIFTLTNTGKEELKSPRLQWRWSVDMYQEYEDSFQELDEGLYMMYLDENKIYRDNQQAIVKPGGSIDLMFTYEIDDMSKPIKMSVHDSSYNEVGEKIYNLQ